MYGVHVLCMEGTGDRGIHMYVHVMMYCVWGIWGMQGCQN